MLNLLYYLVRALLHGLVLLGWLGCNSALLVTGGLWLTYKGLEPTLPDIERLRDIPLQVPMRVFSRDDRLIAEFGEIRRIPLPMAEIPAAVRRAFLAAEDDRFFEHFGVDLQGLLRAVSRLTTTGERRQGGSTITMQVARNFFLTREKTFVRKLKEIFLALRIEKSLGKDEILELYLNKIYLGNRAYGVGAASQAYFGRPLSALTLDEVALLAALPKAPSSLNPFLHPERARQRRNYVLSRLRDLGHISPETYQTAIARDLHVSPHVTPTELDAPYVAEMVRAELVGRLGEEAYTGGYRVYTTLDSPLQEAATAALRDNLEDFDHRHGYRGAIRRVPMPTPGDPVAWTAALQDIPAVAALRPGLILRTQGQSAECFISGQSQTQILAWDGLAWARLQTGQDHRGSKPRQAADILKPGDIVYLSPPTRSRRWALGQIPKAQSGLVALDAEEGAIRALVGGYDFQQSKFNRVTQARRQPGSGFKPFVYSAALEMGFTPASVINDAPLSIETGSPNGPWRPENFGRKYYGPTRLRTALTYSRNLVSVRLLQTIGVDYAVDFAQLFGFSNQYLPHNLTLSLGTADLTPMEMARAYAVFANGGFLVEPYLIERIFDRDQRLVYQATPKSACLDCEENLDDTPAELPGSLRAPRIISPQNRYLMVSMLQDVIRLGTARAALSLKRPDIAGKTGTTNEFRDAWFNGFSPHLVAVIWVGHDDFEPLGEGETGGKAALPAWIQFMSAALNQFPVKPWSMPPGIVSTRIHAQSGLPASRDATDTLDELFDATRPAPPPALPAEPSGDSGEEPSEAIEAIETERDEEVKTHKRPVDPVESLF